MTDYLTVVLGSAFATGSGVDYNRTAYALREAHDWIFYEVVLAEGKSWDEVRDRIFPPLGRFLGFKKLDKSFGAGLVIALFHGEHFYLIAAPDFLGAFCELEDLALDDLPSQVSRWALGVVAASPAR